MSVLDELDPETLALLERFGFDEPRFETLRDRVASGELSAASTIVRGHVEAPQAGDLTPLPAPDTREHVEARQIGIDALRAGLVAQIVLCGGMATRFGGLVKGVVEVYDGRSFLDVKLSETARLARALGGEIPVSLMTSFATDETVRRHLEGLDVPRPDVFSQLISLRLVPDGELFLEETGRASPYAPGHGDLFDAIEQSGMLDRLRERGVQQLAVSNVDNLGARLDPVVIGAHLAGGRPLTIEVTSKDGDVGGAPARVDGRLRLVEGPCFPPDFDQGAIPVFNTNTAIVSVDAVPQGRGLTWLYVEKQVAGRRAVQLERLYHELSDRVPTTYLVVPRRGPRGRFMPVKVPADVERVRPELAEMLAAAPARCAICLVPGAILCAACLRLLPRVGPTGCDRCGAPGPWPVERCVECSGRRLSFARARGVLVYAGPTRALVAGWKERGRRDLTNRLVDLVAATVPRPECDVVTFVPGDRERSLVRGFEPPRALAEGLARRWEIPCDRLVTRAGAGARQAGLRGRQRRENVRGAFSPRAHAPPRVVVVDDVYTTGSTVAACATELRRAGARHVEVLCLARAVR